MVPFVLQTAASIVLVGYLSYLLMFAPESAFIREIQSNTSHLLLLCLLTLLLSILLGLVIANHLTTRISLLNQVSRKLAEGNLLQRLPADSSIAEVKGLAQSFNQMADELQKNFYRLQNALEESEEKITTVFRTSPEPIAITNLAEGRFLEVNKRMLEFYGYTREELIGQKALDLGLWENVEQRQHFRHQLETQGSAHNQEVITRTKSGEIKVILLSAEVCNLSSQDVVIFVIRDINERASLEAERKQAEIALRQSEARFQQLATAVPGMIYIYTEHPDGSQGFEYVSSFSRDILELEPEQIKADINAALDQIHPEDRPAHDAAVALSAVTKEPFTFPFRNITPSGQQKWLEANSRPLQCDDGTIKWYGILLDISERKQAEIMLRQSELKFSTIFRDSPQPAWISTLAEGRCLDVNKGFCKVLGYSYTEAIGKTCVEMGLWNDLTDLQHFRETLLQTESILDFEVVFRTKSGEAKTVLVSARISRLDNQDCVIGTLNDISDRKRSETERKRAEIALQESETRYRILSEVSPVAIFRLDNMFKCLYVNDRWSEMTGRPKDSALGNGWIATLHPDDREELLRQWTAKQEQFTSGKVNLNNGEGRHLRPDGSINWYYVQVVPETDATGQMIGYVGSLTDITARKQAEIALQQAKEQLEKRIEELNQHNREMMLLSEISDFLQACLTVEEVYRAISSLVEPLFPRCSGGIFIMEQSGNWLTNVAFWGTQSHSKLEFYLKDCWGLRRGEIYRVEPDRLGLRCHHIFEAPASVSTLCIPMIAQGETLGLFYLCEETPKALLEGKQQLANMVAEQLALAITHLKLWDNLQQQSIRDPLTGLFNRRYLEEFLEREISRAQRYNHPIGLIILDLDHFKQLNDTYGHDAGDYVLQIIGNLLKENVEDKGIACRYGGEEMILVLPESSLEDTYIKAEKIREAISQLSLNHNGRKLNVLSASFGVACFPQHGTTRTVWMQTADAALYQAKGAGRNRVVVTTLF